jgi:purine-binding chemotaxis protein CheW
MYSMGVQTMADSKQDGPGGVIRKEKYLTFNLAGEQYGLEILKVREIIGLMDITTVPRTPEFVRGVINLRGKVIPIIDLRTKFGIDRVEDTEHTCIIVVDIVEDQLSVQMGIVVDSVSEVLDIDVDDIDATPRFSSSVSTSFIKGIAKTRGGVKILLKIEDVLTTDEIRELPSNAADEAE